MHHSGGRHGDVEASGDDLPSDRVPGRALEPSRSRVDDDGGDGTFRGFLIGVLRVFCRRGISGRKGNLGGAMWAPHHVPAR